MFKTGDLVEIIREDPIKHSCKLGDKGVVVICTPDNKFGVSITEPKEFRGHTLYGNLDRDNGQWLYSEDMKLISVKNEKVENKPYTLQFFIIKDPERGPYLREGIYVKEKNEVFGLYYDNKKLIIKKDPELHSLIERFPMGGFKAKVISCNESIEVFGNAKRRKTLLNQSFEITDFHKKEFKDTIIRCYSIKIPIAKGSLHDDITDSTTIKMVAEDLELIVPSIKGYNAPKDRSFKIGKIVRIRKVKNSRYLKEDRFEIIDVIDRKQDGKIILKLRDKEGNIISEYGRKFKIV